MTTRTTYQIVLKVDGGDVITSTPYESVWNLRQAYNAFALQTDGISLSIIENTITRTAEQNKVSITELAV